jgi:hypothetical protein
MRRSLSVLFVLALGLAACSDDGAETTSSTAAAPTSTEAAPASTAAAPASTAAAPTSTEAAPSGALIPEVCLGGAGAIFGFDNQSTVPVVVPEGPLNQLDGGVVGDNPMRTTLFAVGRTTAAFWVVPDSADTGVVNPVVWTVTGPDGVERAATFDDATPPCDAELLEPNALDPRLASVEGSDATVAADGSTVTLTVTVVGVPELSVCNSAFTAEPVGITLDPSVLPTANEPSATYTLPLRPATTRPGQVAGVTVVANIVDRCTYEGLTVTSWPVTQPFLELGFGLTVCAWVDESGALSFEVTPGLCELGVTGGARIRPG